jgi:Protein of unknown function (DUF727)
MAEEIIDWQKEALAIINDVKSFVKSINISSKLVSDGSCTYLNIVTLEDRRLTVSLDSSGFKIMCNYELDSFQDEETEDVYETIYALLETQSEKYTQAFGNKLVEELEKLK